MQEVKQEQQKKSVQKKPVPSVQQEQQPVEGEKKSNWWIWVIAVLIIAAVLYLFVF